MPDFGFVGASYEAPSIYQDAQECINFFPEVDPTKPQGERGVVALYPTPGLSSLVQEDKQDDYIEIFADYEDYDDEWALNFIEGGTAA